MTVRVKQKIAVSGRIARHEIGRLIVVQGDRTDIYNTKYYRAADEPVSRIEGRVKNDGQKNIGVHG